MLRGIAISKKTGANIYYKCECFQKTGAFKIRGAYNKISSLSEEEKAKGVKYKEMLEKVLENIKDMENM